MAGPGVIVSGFIFCGLFVYAGMKLLPFTASFLAAHGMAAPNYLKKTIPVGTGLYLWSLLIVYLLMVRLWNGMGVSLPTVLFDQTSDFAKAPLSYIFVIAMTVIFFAGWLDDSVGDRTVKGISGHLHRWRAEGIVTTGLLKAGTTVVMSFFVVLSVHRPWLASLFQMLLLTLMTNALNLLDLRPGRTLKVFFAVIGMIAAFGALRACLPFLLPVLAGAVLLFPSDVKAQTMLGDAGANLLGFAAGFALIIAAPWWMQALFFSIALPMHWAAEHGSITIWIESNKMLNWLDRLGRVRNSR